MYHSIACSITGIIFFVELLIPRSYAVRYTAVVREYDDIEFPMAPKTCALLLRATNSLKHSHRIIVMDAGFTSIAVLVRSTRLHTFVTVLWRAFTHCIAVRCVTGSLEVAWIVRHDTAQTEGTQLREGH